MARWPNDGLTRIPVKEVPQGEVERYRRWAKDPNLWLHGYWFREWSDAYEKIASVEPNGMIEVVRPILRMVPRAERPRGERAVRTG